MLLELIAGALMPKEAPERPSRNSKSSSSSNDGGALDLNSTSTVAEIGGGWGGDAFCGEVIARLYLEGLTNCASALCIA